MSEFGHNEHYERIPPQDVDYDAVIEEVKGGIDEVRLSDADKTAESIEPKYFLEDVALFKNISDEFMATHLEKLAAPKGAVFYSNTEKHAFDILVAKAVILNRQGFGAYLSNDAVDNLGRPTEGIAIKYDPRDGERAGILLDAWRQSKDPYYAIAQNASWNGIHFRDLTAVDGQEGGLKIAYPQIFTLSEQDRIALLQRGYLTSLITKALSTEGRSMRWSDMGTRQFITTYETLRSQGVHPFGIEELYGMVHRGIPLDRHNQSLDSKDN